MTRSDSILIVDDSEAQLRFWRQEFETLFPNIIVTTATTVDSAMKLLQKINFRLVYLDGDLGSGLQDEPDTLPLCQMIAKEYRGRIFCITDSPKYQHIMEQYGCVYVKKESVAEHANNFFLRGGAVSYDIAINKLVVISIRNQFPNHYIGKIIATAPLKVCVTESPNQLSSLSLDAINILPDETVLLQGTEEEQQRLFRHFAARTLPLQSGIKPFSTNGRLTAIVPKTEIVGAQ